MVVKSMTEYLLHPYDDALADILLTGKKKEDRTGVGCLSLAGIQCRYRLDEGKFPLITRRKTWPRAIFAELLWFLSGSSNVFDLNRLGSSVWDKWRDPEFEASHGLEPGDLGAVYGFQLRHFGANYKAFRKEERLSRESGVLLYNLDEWGFDQLEYMVWELRNNRYSRRILFSLWNPKDFHIMRLPPCHFTFQVIVDGDDQLTGILTQRSCDWPVGVPANIQFYSALTIMLAQQADLKPYEFIHNANDCHIYLDQIDAVEQYLSTPIIESPRLEIRKAPNITSYKLEDFILHDYKTGPKIDLPVSI